MKNNAFLLIMAFVSIGLLAFFSSLGVESNSKSNKGSLVSLNDEELFIAVGNKQINEEPVDKPTSQTLETTTASFNTNLNNRSVTWPFDQNEQLIIKERTRNLKFIRPYSKGWILDYAHEFNNIDGIVGLLVNSSFYWDQHVFISAHGLSKPNSQLINNTLGNFQPTNFCTFDRCLLAIEAQQHNLLFEEQTCELLTKSLNSSCEYKTYQSFYNTEVRADFYGDNVQAIPKDVNKEITVFFLKGGQLTDQTDLSYREPIEESLLYYSNQVAESKLFERINKSIDKRRINEPALFERANPFVDSINCEGYHCEVIVFDAIVFHQEMFKGVMSNFEVELIPLPAECQFMERLNNEVPISLKYNCALVKEEVLIANYNRRKYISSAKDHKQ